VQAARGLIPLSGGGAAPGGTGGGKIGLDLFEHPRQRDGEREEGSV